MLRLQELSLVSKVATVIKTEWGVEDKTLAEFVIEVGKVAPDSASFYKELEENGAACERHVANQIYDIIQNPGGIKKRPAPEPIQNMERKEFSHTPSSPSNAQEKSRIEERNKKYCAYQGALGIEDGLGDLTHENIWFQERTDGKISESAQKLLDAEMTNDERRKKERAEKKSGGGPGASDRRSRSRSPKKKVNLPSIEEGASDSDEEKRPINKVRPRGSPLEVHGIYEAKVDRIMEYGAFMEVFCEQGGRSGMCHVNELKKTGGTQVNAKDLVHRGQIVYVKVLGVVNLKLNLTMRDVDQQTGVDLRPEHKKKKPKKEVHDPNKKVGDITGVPLEIKDSQVVSGHQDRERNRLSEYELWECRQLKNSGVLEIEEQMDYDKEKGMLFDDTAVDENFEVEIKEEEPLFLRGQTTRDGAMMEPINLVKEPDGSLARSAAGATVAAKERRESRDAMQQSLVDAIPKDMGRPWEDPRPEPGERTVAAALRGLGTNRYEVPEWKKLYLGKSVTYGQRSSLPIREQREGLPIYRLRDALLKAIHENSVLIVIGETGSGKTTQITQYLAEAGYCNNGLIVGCTQPRRVAAMSVAKRVAEEFGCRLGQEVGYAIRFEDQTSKDTMIKYQTDGMLLREILQDPLLKKYSIIMLDEAHERTINTDVLFGLLKKTLRERGAAWMIDKAGNKIVIPEKNRLAPLKLIVTSATLDAEKFSTYFFDSHIFTIPGRTFPVEIMYSKEPEHDYVEAALMTVLQIHLCEPSGDILLFLTGQEEIDTACQILHERMEKLEANNPPPLIILPVYSALPSEMQTMIFDPPPPGCRKCVVATNIAEASLTIDGIYFVVDPGQAKTKSFNSKTGMDSLIITPISKASARQRAGRAGRTGPGKCYRLYTEMAYRNEMLDSAIPEIQRSSLTSVVLMLKAMKINDMIAFDWMDPPPTETLINSMETLYHLGATNQEGLLTELGFLMAQYPMEPNLSKMLLVSMDTGCSDEVVSVIAMLSVQNVFYRPRDKQAVADQKKAQFHQVEGDHITLLTVYQAWARNNYNNAWCYENYVQSRALRRAQDVRKQLIMVMGRQNREVQTCGKNYTKVRQAIVAGFFHHACKRDPTEGYRTLNENNQVFVHPSSALHMKNPEFIVYHELVLTTREYLRECCTLDPGWLIELAPSMYQKCPDHKMSRLKMRERIEPLYNRFAEKNAWRLSRRRG